jgi:outer membrane protein OmpA-like peptidoglycan-associated protein
MNVRLGTRLVAAAVAAAMFAGCTTINPYSRETQVSKAATGAAIGAAAGAAIGAISGDNSHERRKRALIGAGAGAIAGGSVGYYMDVQEAKLRQKLEGSGVSVTRVGDSIVLNMPSNVTFQTDSADLRPEFFDVMSSVALVLIEYDKTLVNVAGHTDSTGSDDYNLRLSQRRADSVASFLRSQGVDGLRLQTYAFGETQPIASNDTPSGRQLNRRVEISLVPLTA